MDDRVARQRAATYRFWREDVAGRPQGEWAVLDGVQVHTTGLPPRHWNGAFLTRRTDLVAVLPAVSSWFEARDKPWGLLVPAELDVVPPGLTHALDQRVMLRDLDALPQGGAADLRADAPPEDVAVVQAEAFGDGYDLSLAFVLPSLRPDASPPQHTVTAYAGDVPIGCATVAVLGTVAGVFGVAVRDGWRRRGLGAALTVRCLELARAAGCDLAYLNPSDMAYGGYARLGFAETLPFRVWVPT